MYPQNIRLSAVILSSSSVGYTTAHQVPYFATSSAAKLFRGSSAFWSRKRNYLQQQRIIGTFTMPCATLNMVLNGDCSEDIFWKPGTALPTELAHGSDPFLTSLVPRPTAWISVQDKNNDRSSLKVALLVSVFFLCHNL